MPTVSSATHKAGAANPELNVHKGFELRLVEVFDGERLRREWLDILDIVAAARPGAGQRPPARPTRRSGCSAKPPAAAINRLLVNHPKMPFLGWHDAGRRRPTPARRTPRTRHPARPARPRRPHQPRSCSTNTRTSCWCSAATSDTPTTRPPPQPSRAGCTNWRQRIGPDAAHSILTTNGRKLLLAMTIIALLPGDGVGGEILDGPVAFLQPAGRRRATDHPHRADAVRQLRVAADRRGSARRKPIEACREADVILAGAVGTHPGVSSEECPHPESALIGLRHMFDLRISVRTVWVPGSRRRDDRPQHHRRRLRRAVPPHRERRHLGRHRPDPVCCPNGCARCSSWPPTSPRPIPGRRYVSVDKPSVFATSRLWRATRQGRSPPTGMSLSSIVNVDRAAYELVKYDELPAVIATEGIFGDILSDIVGARAGSPALCGSATINPDRKFGSGATGLFEPAHGTAPHRTGTRRSNPTGAWLALGALLDWCPDLQPRGLGADIRTALARGARRRFPHRRPGRPRPARPSTWTSSTADPRHRWRPTVAEPNFWRYLTDPAVAAPGPRVRPHPGPPGRRPHRHRRPLPGGPGRRRPPNTAGTR